MARMTRMVTRRNGPGFPRFISRLKRQGARGYPAHTDRPSPALRCPARHGHGQGPAAGGPSARPRADPAAPTTDMLMRARVRACTRACDRERVFGCGSARALSARGEGTGDVLVRVDPRQLRLRPGQRGAPLSLALPRRPTPSPLPPPPSACPSLRRHPLLAGVLARPTSGLPLPPSLPPSVCFSPRPLARLRRLERFGGADCAAVREFACVLADVRVCMCTSVCVCLLGARGEGRERACVRACISSKGPWPEWRGGVGGGGADLISRRLSILVGERYLRRCGARSERISPRDDRGKGRAAGRGELLRWC